MDAKIAKILEAIECENTEGIDENTLLTDIQEWDSMGAISIITMLATDYGYTLNYDELRKLSKIGDITALMK